MDEVARARTENSFAQEDARDLDRQGHEAHGWSPAPKGSRDGALARPPALTLLPAKQLSFAEGRQQIQGMPASDGAGVLSVFLERNRAPCVPVRGASVRLLVYSAAFSAPAARE